MRFFLGTHQTHWLGIADVPLFVSHRRLSKRKSFPRALAPWALDSGGFTEIEKYGRWQTEAVCYAEATALYADRIGSLEWAAIQDWMCEPFMIAKTGKSVRDHQDLTIRSYFELRALAPSLPWIPILQGWEMDDYFSHVDQWSAAGLDLTSVPVVGVGSVCRRQATSFAFNLFVNLASMGIRCHAFGLKTLGIERSALHLASSDSLAWSYAARRNNPLPGCSHPKCVNCLRYALLWRENILRLIGKANRRGSFYSVR